jgi:hypothetical protein
MPSIPILLSNQIIMKSLYAKEFEKFSLESMSMEAEYKDFHSGEIEEGIHIYMKEMPAK